MPDFAHELRHHPGLVAGVDEAGRGPLAGPVVAAAVILRQEDCPDGLNDSKQLSAAKRAVLEGQVDGPETEDPVRGRAHEESGDGH